MKDQDDDEHRTAPPRLTVVVAAAENDVIGRGNALPWRLKTDLRRFRTLTWGKPMIMGRKSWDSIGRPLPGRETIVLTRDTAFRPEGAHVAHDWPSAKALAREVASGMSAAEIAVVGGAEIYRLALPEADILHLTRVDARPQGDVTLPPFDRAAFRETRRVSHPAGADDDYPFTFLDFERVA